MVSQMPPIEATSASYPSSQVSTPMSSASSVVGTPDLSGDLSLSWNGMEIPLQPRPTVFGSHIRDSADDLSFYSSPDTCASPASDTTGFVMQPSSAPTSVMEPFASGVFHPDLTASPIQLPATTSHEWDGLDAVSATPMMPLSLDGSDMTQPVGEPSLLLSESLPTSIFFLANIVEKNKRTSSVNTPLQPGWG